MIATLAVLAGLMVQTGATRAPVPVRVWRSDSTVYVTLREPGHLVLLHVDAIGRIRVLFPLAPDDSTAVSGGNAALALPPTAEGNPSTFVAVRSRWAFDFAALRIGSDWNYHDALLLQPTGGDPLAALLEIADRITDGRPYDYGVVEYQRGGSLAAARRDPLQPTVCLSCVRRGATVAAAPAPVPTTAVDCSNASLTNSFCGVANASVSISSVPQASYQPAAPAAPAPVYVPYYLPLIVHRGHSRFERPPLPPPPAAPRPSVGAAFPIAPRLDVPSRAQIRTVTSRRP